MVYIFISFYFCLGHFSSMYMLNINFCRQEEKEKHESYFEDPHRNPSRCARAWPSGGHALTEWRPRLGYCGSGLHGMDLTALEGGSAQCWCAVCGTHLWERVAEAPGGAPLDCRRPARIVDGVVLQLVPDWRQNNGRRDGREHPNSPPRTVYRAASLSPAAASLYFVKMAAGSSADL